MKKSVSIIVPAYNDEETLYGTIKDVDRIAGKVFGDYEFLIFDDGSTDRTGEIVDRLARGNSRIRAFHNGKNMNIGYSYKVGVVEAKKDYVMLLPGPDSLTIESLEQYMRRIGQADVVTSYSGNREARLPYRLAVSALASATLNLLFGLRLRYYFGMQMYRTSLVRKVRMTTSSFGIYPEILIQLVKAGCSCKEVPIVALPETNSTTAFRARNIAGILSVVFRLFFRLHFRRVRRLF